MRFLINTLTLFCLVLIAISTPRLSNARTTGETYALQVEPIVAVGQSPLDRKHWTGYQLRLWVNGAPTDDTHPLPFDPQTDLFSEWTSDNRMIWHTFDPQIYQETYKLYDWRTDTLETFGPDRYFTQLAGSPWLLQVDIFSLYPFSNALFAHLTDDRQFGIEAAYTIAPIPDSDGDYVVATPLAIYRLTNEGLVHIRDASSTDAGYLVLFRDYPYFNDESTTLYGFDLGNNRFFWIDFAEDNRMSACTLEELPDFALSPDKQWIFYFQGTTEGTTLYRIDRDLCGTPDVVILQDQLDDTYKLGFQTDGEWAYGNIRDTIYRFKYNAEPLEVEILTNEDDGPIISARIQWDMTPRDGIITYAHPIETPEASYAVGGYFYMPFESAEWTQLAASPRTATLVGNTFLYVDSGDFGLYRMPLDTLQAQRITPEGLEVAEWLYTWEDTVFFVEGDRLWRIQEDGSGLQELAAGLPVVFVRGADFKLYPFSWTDDGRHFWYTEDQTQLHWLAADGSDHQIFDRRGFESFFWGQADGRDYLFATVQNNTAYYLDVQTGEWHLMVTHYGEYGLITGEDVRHHPDFSLPKPLTPADDPRQWSALGLLGVIVARLTAWRRENRLF